MINKRIIFIVLLAFGFFTNLKGMACEIGSLEWVQEKYKKYPELEWLMDEKVRVTQENKSQSTTAWSKKIKGALYPEFERTLLTLAVLGWIHEGSEKSYQSLTANQDPKVRLTQDSFKKLHSFFKENIVNQEDYDMVEKNLILGDMGKTPKAREIFSHEKVTDEDHDQFLKHALDINGDLFPTFEKSSDEEKSILKQINGLIHLGHITHVEGGPEMFDELWKSHILDKNGGLFTKEVITHICDVAGALGHVTNQGSLVLTENTAIALRFLIETLDVLKNEKPEEALTLYLSKRADLLGLDIKEESAMVLTRLACMLRLFSKEDGKNLHEAWSKLDSFSQEEIMKEFNPLIRKEIQTPTYIPAVMVNVYNSTPDKKVVLSLIFSETLPFMLKIIKDFEDKKDLKTVLSFNNLAGQIKKAPESVKKGTSYKVDDKGNVTAQV